MYDLASEWEARRRRTANVLVIFGCDSAVWHIFGAHVYT